MRDQREREIREREDSNKECPFARLLSTLLKPTTLHIKREFIAAHTQLFLYLCGLSSACVPNSLKDSVQLHPKGLQHKSNEN